MRRLPFLALFVCVATVARADTLDLVRSRGELRWGMDAQGGAPYVFQSPTDPNLLVGFEVDLANALARKLGVRARPMQAQWDQLLELLARGDFDVALNGIEVADEKKRVCELSRPYYVADERLTVRRDSARPEGGRGTPTQPSQLKGMTVGTLPGSLAERILDRVGANVRSYDGGQGEIYDDLRLGRTNGVLLDGPITLYYGAIEPKLQVVDASFGEVRYAVAVRLGDDRLREAIDQALDELAKDGTLERIYSRWGLWNAKTAALFGLDYAPGASVPVEYESWRAAVGKLPPFWERVKTRYPATIAIFGRAAALTLAVSLAAMLLAILFGLVLALSRAYGPRPVRWTALTYVEFFRGTPLLVQLTMIYFGLPELGISLNPFVAGVIALGFNYAAAEAENYRAGLQSVPAGQLEAAKALGLSKWQAIVHVVAPQAVRTALPPATNDFIALLKDSSLVSLVTLTELTKAYTNLASSMRDHLGLGALVALWYLAIGLPFAHLARRVEARLGSHLKRAVE